MGCIQAYMTSWTHLDMLFWLPSYIYLILHFLGLSPTLRNECVALQPHLAPPTPPVCLYVSHMTHPSFTTSVCHVTSPSIIPPAPTVCPFSCPHVTQSVRHMDMSVCHTTCQSVCQSTPKSVALSVHSTSSPSIIPICTSYTQSVHHPINSSMTCHSVTPPISPEIYPSDCPSLLDHLYTILPHQSGCPTSFDHSSNLYTCLSDCLPPSDCLYDKPPSPSACLSLPDCLYDEPFSPSACLSLSDCLTTTMTRPAVCPSTHMIHCTQDSSQSISVMNGSNPTRTRNSIGPVLTTTYFYVPSMYLAST